jgi:hypothetical protein
MNARDAFSAGMTLFGIHVTLFRPHVTLHVTPSIDNVRTKEALP